MQVIPILRQAPDKTLCVFFSYCVLTLACPCLDCRPPTVIERYCRAVEQLCIQLYSTCLLISFWFSACNGVLLCALKEYGYRLLITDSLPYGHTLPLLSPGYYVFWWELRNVRSSHSRLYDDVIGNHKRHNFARWRNCYILQNHHCQRNHDIHTKLRTRHYFILYSSSSIKHIKVTAILPATT
jgi:hypothetical protein